MAPTYLAMEAAVRELGLANQGQLGLRLARHPEIRPDAWWKTSTGSLRPLFLPETIAKLGLLEPVAKRS